ncbi:hypothetical protein ES707_09979 [subsurface metagenome]
MNFKDFFERRIRGWFPEEPKMPKNLLKKSSMPITSYLKLTNSLKIVYALTLGFVASVFLAWLILYYWQDWTPDIFSSYIYGLPYLFFINALPVAIFGVVFLTKGNGLNYFRSWNAGKKLQFSGLAIVTGYISVMLLYILRVRLFIIQFDANGHFSIPQVNPIYPILVYFGLSIMAVGFGSLLLIHKTTASSEEKTDTQKRKTTKKTVFLVFVIVVLSVSLVCLVGVHYKLQRDYDNVSETFRLAVRPIARVVNEQWTDNVGVDSNYVNYKAGVLNFGYDKVYNVTLRVSIYGIDDTLLKREDIFVEEISALNYVTVDVNIEYSGELSHVSGVAIRWAY